MRRGTRGQKGGLGWLAEALPLFTLRSGQVDESQNREGLSRSTMGGWPSHCVLRTRFALQDREVDSRLPGSLPVSRSGAQGSKAVLPCRK